MEGRQCPTTTKWVWKKFVSSWLVARKFKPKREGPRDDFFAAMPQLEAKKALFAFGARARAKRRVRDLAEVKLMFVDVKKAHLGVGCDEEERVQLLDEFEEHGRHAKGGRWLFCRWGRKTTSHEN